VAVGRGSESAALAKKLGASVYIDNKVTNPAEALQKIGWRTGDSSRSPKLESEVRADRPSVAERKAYGDQCDATIV